MQRATVYRLQLLCVLTAAAVLLLAGSWFSYTSTFDTATVGLMSVNINNGIFPIFFYGQPYFGALEAYVGALFLKLLGFSEFAVSLAPISFTLLWIFFTYLLFARILNRQGGIIAALCVAFPGYYVFWYSIATYGGYSVIPFVGTAVLWLSLLIFQENPRKYILLLYCLCVGILTAIAIWVHALTFPYIGIAAIILVLFAIKERFRLDIVISFAIAFVVALTGFIPFEIETGSFLGGLSPGVPITLPRIEQTVNTLFTVNIRELVVWNFLRHLDSNVVSYLVIYGSRLLIVSAVSFACISFLLPGRAIRRKLYYLIPLSFCLLFLSMYVQHHMATVKAPRYAIGFWTMILCALWSAAIAGHKNKFLKNISLLFFFSWLVLQISGTVLFIKGNAEGARKEQKTIQAVVDGARDNNLKSVVIFGDRLLGYKAQKFSMFSQNKIIFSNAELERYDGNAQFAELDTSRGYLTNFQSKVPLENTFKELGVHFKITKVNEYFLFSHLKNGQLYTTHSVPYTIINNSIQDSTKIPLLNDGNQDTGFQSPDYKGKPITLDVGEIKLLCGMWMFTSQDPSQFYWERPGQFELFSSKDNISFKKVFKSLPNTGNAFYAGEHVYVGGPWGKIDVRFEPVEARFLQIKFKGTAHPRVTELFVFKTDLSKRTSSQKDLAQIERVIKDHDLQFVWADRWLSANLLEMHKGESRKVKIALPRHSTKYAYKPLKYFINPEKGNGIICDNAVSEYCQNSLVHLYGKSVISKTYRFENYSLFVFNNVNVRDYSGTHSALIWNGHVPVKATETKLLAYWLHDQGVPFWRADYTKTSGIYPDLWTNGDGKFEDLSYRIQKKYDSTLIISTNGERFQEDQSSLQLRVSVNENIPLVLSSKNNNTYSFKLPESLERIDTVEVKSSTFSSKKGDGRLLGLNIAWIEIR